MRPLAAPILALAIALAAASPAPAVEVPGGSSARLEPTDGAGFVRIVSGSGRQEYYAAVEALVGFVPKANGKGCIVYVQTEAGVQVTEVETSADDLLKAVKASRSLAK